MGREQLVVGLVRVDAIDYHPFNHKRSLGDLRPLVESVRRNGLIHPVVLERRGERFRIRAGHRRVAAARIAGLPKVPALIHPDALPEEQWLVHMVEENTLRKDLDAGERRRVIIRLRDLRVPWVGIGAAFGVSPATARAWAAGQEPPPPRASAGPPVPARPDEPVASRPRRRPARVVAVRAVRAALEDLTARQGAGGLTVEECLTALRALLPATVEGDVS